MHEGYAFVYQAGPYMALVWYLAATVPFAIGFHAVAKRIGRCSVAWAILPLIPVVNWFFAIYAVFTTVIYMLDRLNGPAPRTDAQV